MIQGIHPASNFHAIPIFLVCMIPANAPSATIIGAKKIPMEEVSAAAPVVRKIWIIS